MALLTAINRDAQEQIMSGLINVHLRHSERSKQSFNDKLSKLAERQDLDVVITSFHLSMHLNAPEFSLGFFKKTDSEYNGSHPLDNPQNVLMIGGLVYHNCTDTWAVHT